MKNNRKNIVIIDYKLGNLFSVKQACESAGIETKISSEYKDIQYADALILPGVGAFNEAMLNLKKLSLFNPIKKANENNIPIFGICLGLQLLFEESEEFKSSKGLGILSGNVVKFPSKQENIELRIPHIAWNQISISTKLKNETPLRSIKEDSFMYFVHSYYVEPNNNEIVLSMTNYENVKYCSSVFHKNIFATQFHPEKSGKVGLKIYKDWALMNNLI